MTRLYLRFYIGVLICFVLTLAIVLAWLLNESAEDRAVVEDSMRGGISLALEQLQGKSANESPAMLASLQERFGYELRILSRDELEISLGDIARLDAQEGPVYRDRSLYASLGNDETLVLGPLPSFQLGMGATWVVVIVVALWALASMLLLRPVVKATSRFERAAQQMSDGDLSTRIELRGVAPQSLARSFNAMAQTTEKLLGDQRHLLAAVSHEFRTPLARLRFAQEMAGDTRSADERKQLLLEMDEDIVELEDLVSELIEYIRLGDSKSTSQQKSFVLGELLPPLLEAKSSSSLAIEFRSDLDDTELCLHDSRLFARAVKNLVANARRHAASSVTVEVAKHANGGIWLHVDDDGPGIPLEERERVLEPFVQLGGNRDSGSGLGLAIVARIAESRGGEALVSSSSLGGARVSISWPQ